MSQGTSFRTSRMERWQHGISGVRSMSAPCCPRKRGSPRREQCGSSVELHNDSDEPILRWFPRLYDYGLRTEYDVPEQPMGLVDPHSVTRIVLAAINPHPNPGEPGFLVNVTFEDSAGRLWRRAHGKAIEELSGKDPSRKSFPR